jgi:hypothetical protein
LSFAGTVNILHATHTVGFTSSSDIFVGFFNSEQQWWRPANFLGFRLRGHNEPIQNIASLELSYGTSAWQAGGIDWGLEWANHAPVGRHANPDARLAVGPPRYGRYVQSFRNLQQSIARAPGR